MFPQSRALQAPACRDRRAFSAWLGAFALVGGLSACDRLSGASTPGAFWRYPVSCLVPMWANPLIQVEDLGDRFPGEFNVSAQNSPVIEYHPCHWEETTSTVTRSRFYWAYSGDLPVEATRQINKLFRWVQRNTVAVEGPFWRFFPVAAQTARFARQELTWKSEANPLFQK